MQDRDRGRAGQVSMGLSRNGTAGRTPSSDASSNQDTAPFCLALPCIGPAQAAQTHQGGAQNSCSDLLGHYTLQGCCYGHLSKSQQNGPTESYNARSARVSAHIGTMQQTMAQKLQARSRKTRAGHSRIFRVKFGGQGRATGY